ncbi:hypothetical protein HNP84_006979 [Thermocatellispora tengchongensis]|uniref:Uncharacterized protein n=1 Tax=Thermocatellispora tengchongensis TaxID=1073253 RepID=A0A840PJF8_9ACTN|nr:hypothetical protein [Thermocatellispora tengchongensis]MBB5137227.1 hypothetical protein [Thermocatellispora tengchongensis]
MSEASRARDPRLIDSTTRLVEFLRNLASARRTPVLDVDRHGQVLWLANLPEAITPHAEAGLGEVLLSFDHVRPTSPPPPPTELDGWLDHREVADPEQAAPELSETGPGRIEEIHEDGTTSWRPETVDDRPEVVKAYGEWLPTWQAWAEQERNAPGNGAGTVTSTPSPTTCPRWMTNGSWCWPPGC